MNDRDRVIEVFVAAWEPFFEAMFKASKIIISEVIDFLYQYRRRQLLIWLLEHRIPVGPAKWLSEKCPKCLLPKFDLKEEVSDEQLHL